MDLKKLFSNDSDRAVSPVIGVILMVAITVILAAVIGAFVLGQADELNETAPNATFDYSSEEGDVTITHSGGDNFNNEQVEVIYEDTNEEWDAPSEDPVATGDTHDTNETVASGEEIRIVWSAPEGGSSDTIGTYTVP